jgi:hypothetical protein
LNSRALPWFVVQALPGVLQFSLSSSSMPLAKSPRNFPSPFAIYVDQKLLTLDLSLGFHGSDNIVRLVGPCHAVGQISKIITTGVRNLDSPQTLLTISQPRHPSILPKHCSNLPTSNFCPELVNPPQLLWTWLEERDHHPSATTSQEVIVKFTARYTEVAHRLTR